MWYPDGGAVQTVVPRAADVNVGRRKNSRTIVSAPVYAILCETGRKLYS
jgi:hypothetical protein